MHETFVIVGAGPAGWSAASTLRTEGFDGHVILIGQESHLPYDRPPLSKEFVRGEIAQEELALRPPSWYSENEIETQLRTGVLGLDPSRRVVYLGDNGEIAYDKLLIASGARPRRLSVPGADLEGILYLRTLDDADGIKRMLAGTTRVAVVGGGFIGSEVAASARMLGSEVTVLEALDAPLENALGRAMGELCAAIHRDKGVDLRTGDAVAAFEGSRRVERIRTTNGTVIDCDLVVVGVGILPNVDFAEATTVTVRHGVIVDQFCRSSADGVYAAGDVARHHHPLFGLVRVEHWQNALQQAATAARNMLGLAKPYTDVHWFWSNQYEYNFQYAGYARTWDEIVVRGDLSERQFAAFYVKNGRVKAVFAVNRSREVRKAIELISSSTEVDVTQLRDEDIDVRELVARPAIR